MSETFDKLAELLCPPNVWGAAAYAVSRAKYEEKINFLVLGWPSLAATLAQLLEENGRSAPLPLKRAYQIIEKENHG